MSKGRKLTRRAFLKGTAGLAGLLAVGGISKDVLSQSCEGTEFRGVGVVDFDYDNDSYQYMRPFYERWFDEIKDLGANWVEIIVPCKIKSDGSVWYNSYDAPYWLPIDDDEGTEENIKRHVRLAQSKGFKVFLNMSPFVKQDHDTRDFFGWIKEYEDLTLRWAEYAEELGVDAFGPEGEFGGTEFHMGLEPQSHYPNGDWYVHTPRLRRWIQQLIPKVKSRYSGPIIIQENVYTHPDVDFSGADYIGLHLHANIEEIGDERFIPGRTPRKYREYLRKHLEAAQEAAERDNCRVMVSEASFGCIDTGLGCAGATLVNEQQQKELAEAFFEEVWGKTDGVFTWEWDDASFEFHRSLAVNARPAEEVVRRYYQSC